MKNRLESKFIFGGRLLIVAAFILLAYNMLTNCSADRESNAAAAALLLSTEESQKEQSKWEGAIPDYILNPKMDMPIQTIDGIDYIGMLSIPQLGIELPVISNWSYGNLKQAPCCYYGSVYLNNMVICAHNYGAHFGSIKNLRIGDSVSFTDVDGNEFAFKVVEVETLQPTAIEEMTLNNCDLTLFTCTIGGTARVTVRCDLETQ